MLDNTVSELVQRVRDITDEDNITDISDALIIRMLNRAQQELVRTLTKRYNNHFMREEIFSTTSLTADANGQSRVLKISDQAFGFAVNSVEAKQGDGWFAVNQVPFSYTLGLDNSSGASIPLSYAMQGQKVFLFPTPGTGVQIRIRYQFRAPKLVASQGRITAFNATTETVTLDAIGSSLSTSVDNLTAFINIIDHLTGEIKATVQIASGIGSTNKTLQITTGTPDRTEVFGYTTTAVLPSNIALDDYVCAADGTTVPLLSHDLTNYLVDIAGFYVKRKLGIVDAADFADRDDIIKSIEGMHFGRQSTKKIERRGSGNYSWQPWFRGS